MIQGMIKLSVQCGNRISRVLKSILHLTILKRPAHSILHQEILLYGSLAMKMSKEERATKKYQVLVPVLILKVFPTLRNSLIRRDLIRRSHVVPVIISYGDWGHLFITG